MNETLSFRVKRTGADVSVGEWIEARKALEVAIAGLAAEKRSVEDLQVLESILDKMSHMPESVDGMIEADAEFHAAVAACTHNRALIGMAARVMEELEEAADGKKPVRFAAEPLAHQMWREHRGIYQAIKEHNAYLAQEKMKQHLFHVERVLLRFNR